MIILKISVYVQVCKKQLAQCYVFSLHTDTVCDTLYHCTHIGFRTPTALGPQESYQTTKIYSPILQVKQRGDVIFHLGTVITLVVSGSLLWLVGRSEFCGVCLCSLLLKPAFPLPFASTPPHPDNNK